MKGLRASRGSRSSRPGVDTGKSRTRGASRASAPPRLLTGGNPQIAKADGSAPINAYIEAMPGWKSAMGRRIDRCITRAVPGVRKAVRWNSPFYGTTERGWFLGMHCFTKYIKVAFFNGAKLTPKPPGESKDANTRYLNIHEADSLDEAQFAKWCRKASRLKGWGGCVSAIAGYAEFGCVVGGAGVAESA